MSGNKKWNESDQFPIWLVSLVALTLQCHVYPVCNSDVMSYVWFVTSNPVSVQLVAIIKLAESKFEDVSISIDHPPIVTPVELMFQDNCGEVSGAGLIPLSTDQDPFRGAWGTGSEGSASEPGT